MLPNIMESSKSVNITAVYSSKIRLLALSVAGFFGLCWLLNELVLKLHSLEQIAIWLSIAALSVANFSQSKASQGKSLLSRYLSYKGAFSVLIGTLMSISLMEIVFQKSLELSPLHLAVGLNLLIFVTEKLLRYQNESLSITNESLQNLFFNHPRIMYTWLIGCLLSMVILILSLF